MPYSSRSRFTLTARCRVRYWTDSAVIGSELFVREIAAKLFGSDRAERKRLAKGDPRGASGPPLFAYRQLSPTL